MRKLLILFISGFMSTAYSQQGPGLTSKLADQASKEAAKEAKKLQKDGWNVAPGSVPLDRIVENAWMKQVMEDDNGNPKYLYADGNAVAETKSAAQMQAIEVAKLMLAADLQSNISSLVSANIGNAQLSTQEAASVTEVVLSSKNQIAVKLGYTDPTFKLFRNIGKDRVEVQVRLFYEIKQSMDIAKGVIRNELQTKLKLNEEKLEKLLTSS
ncbi:MAG: hypothetical protein MUE74_02895 [Bacteroidales bacterium]|jgi:hypothetical protein|nr:hypothetical protein [Bacteroidales bacterium]